MKKAKEIERVDLDSVSGGMATLHFDGDGNLLNPEDLDLSRIEMVNGNMVISDIGNYGK